ncbi:MAG: thioredoxin family protein [Bacteroidia bacterium]
MSNKKKIAGIVVMIAVFAMAFVPAEKTANGSKLNYFKGTYEEALALAKKEDKLLFMDAYTSWCGWCKELDKRTFSNQKLADYMNSHFVILKMDMESKAGVPLAKKFNVNAYPTLLFINHKEKITHRIEGFLEAKAMLKEVKLAQGKFENSK